MRHSLIFIACLFLGAACMDATHAASTTDRARNAPGAGGGEPAVWLVHFEEAPLATFRGYGQQVNPKLRGLQATSPAATGKARLDVGSKASRAYRNALAEVRDDHLAAASQRLGRSLEPLFVYDVVNHGVALQLTEAEARMLEDVRGIASIEPDYVHEPLTDAGPTWIKADALWNAPGGGYRGEGRIVAVIDTGINAAHNSFLPSSGGYTFTNPRGSFLGLCATNATAGCNSKLIGMYDMTTGEGDDEPNDGKDLSGHGTHVASTAAGNPLTAGPYSLSGVAPRANLISYKVCEEESKCRGSWTLAAINRAVADQVDVINYSLGGGVSDPWKSSGTLAMLNARVAGVVVVVAAGNDGPERGSLTSPANAPWVIGVANTTHDRADVARLVLTGGATSPPGGGSLAGASLTAQAYGPAPIVHGGDYGSALCATGSNVDALPPDTSTSPWSGKPFSGQIVVCDRGIYARVVKGLNVKNAGGGGMVLINMTEDGASIVSDDHELPATHLTYADGKALMEWLSKGTGHKARIEGSSVDRVASFADVLASSSGRGPIDGDWLKPNVAAPGSNILAAYTGGAGSLAYSSGTSMASPHIAGAVALLRQMHPDWGPAEIESALQSTARPSVRLPDGVSAASAFDAGGGVVDLSRAGKASLVFPVTGAEMRAADPSHGGKPRELNQGALVERNCLVTCDFERSVKNVSSRGEWQVHVTMREGELDVSPSRFTVAAGASQRLKFKYSVSEETTYGEWNEGQVRISRVGGGAPDVLMPVAIRASAGNLPDSVVLAQGGSTVTSESGWAEIPLSGLVAFSSARFSGSDLIEPLIAAPMIPADPTPDEVYDGLKQSQEGVSIFRLRADRTGRMRLRVEASSGTAKDIDLFVGRAASAGALPSKASEICRSSAPQANERCDLEVDVSAGEHFWILVQNWEASAAGKDKVSLQAGLIPLQPSVQANPPLVATGPGHVDLRKSFRVRVAWDDPRMAPGESRWGHVLLGASETNPTGVGRILVKLTRTKTVKHAAVALQPDVARRMRLLPGHSHDRLFIEVPANATALRVRSRGEGEVKLYLARDLSPSSPGIDAAPPRSAASASSTQPGANDDLGISGATLKPGRWYVTPANIGDDPAEFELVTSLEYGSPALRPGWGNWYNPARSGAGFVLSPYGGGSIWTMTWYAYLQDGTPTWYGGSTPTPEARQGNTSFDLYRYSWDGEKSHAVVVGHASLMLQDSDTMWVSWQLDGEAGSQQVKRLDAEGCGALPGSSNKPDGNWYTPSMSGFGFDVLAYDQLETYIAYLYDGHGVPRWVRAYREENASMGERVDLEASLLRGACPLCTYRASTVEPVGTFRRRYYSPTSARMGATLSFPSPMTGSWRTYEDVIMLTSPVTCP